MLNFFEATALNTIKKYNMIEENDKIVVGLSGGADSSVLLTVLKKLSDKIGFTVCAAHLNHGIRGDEAKRDMEFSKDLSERLNIDFYQKTVNVPEYASKNHISEELAGRKLRYEFFDELCRKHGFNKIAVAHNKNDSAETILFNLIRGSGSKGLCGITPVNNNVVRPLIETSREEIEQYAKENSINFVTDSTNYCDIYSRNILRNNVISQFKRINENAVNNIIRCSDILFSENEFMTEYAKSLNLLQFADNKILLNREKFDAQHIAVKRILVIEAIKLLNQNTNNFSSVHAENIISGCKTGSVIMFPSDVAAIFEHDNIVFTKEFFEIPDYEYIVKIPDKIIVKETGLAYNFEVVDINDVDDKNQYISLDNAILSEITLRTRRDGDIFAPSGMNGNKKVKKYYIDNKIPKYQRNKYPLLVINNEIAAIMQQRVSRNFVINENTKKILKITVTGGSNE